MTEYADRMSAIVKRAHPHLKAAGFKKRRHVFNRSVEDGVVQVISFQMGARLPPGASPIPGWRPDLYGLFTVNMGIAVRETWERLTHPNKEFPGFVNDYDCHVRERLGQVIGHLRDTWWPLDEELSAAGSVVGALIDPGLTWLESRGTRLGILRLWSAGSEPALPIPTPLPIVVILQHLGEIAKADQLIRSYYVTITDHESHRRYVYELARSLGIDDLAPP